MKILVYDDTPDFGGHQIMAARGVEALGADPSTEIIRQKSPSDFHTLKPDLVLCIQGDITQSTLGMLAAKRAGIECISYIATPHRKTAMGARFGTLRDLAGQRLINRPDRYITISESMKQILRDRGCTKPIDIVPNGIPAPQTSNPKPQTSNFTLGLLGRIEFKQKQQNFMVRTFLAHPDIFKNCRLLIGGDGPDKRKLQKLIQGKDNIELLRWQDDTEALYEQIDRLLLPSRFEGVPLVMLEALARGIPVLGSRCDGMAELLPETWTFEPENAAALVSTFSALQKNGTPEIAALQQKVLSEYSLEKFQRNFRRAVLQNG